MPFYLIAVGTHTTLFECSSIDVLMRKCKELVPSTANGASVKLCSPDGVIVIETQSTLDRYATTVATPFVPLSLVQDDTPTVTIASHDVPPRGGGSQLPFFDDQKVREEERNRISAEEKYRKSQIDERERQYLEKKAAEEKAVADRVGNQETMQREEAMRKEAVEKSRREAEAAEARRAAAIEQARQEASAAEALRRQREQQGREAPPATPPQPAAVPTAESYRTVLPALSDSTVSQRVDETITAAEVLSCATFVDLRLHVLARIARSSSADNTKGYLHFIRSDTRELVCTPPDYDVFRTVLSNAKSSQRFRESEIVMQWRWDPSPNSVPKVTPRGVSSTTTTPVATSGTVESKPSRYMDASSASSLLLPTTPTVAEVSPIPELYAEQEKRAERYSFNTSSSSILISPQKAFVTTSSLLSGTLRRNQLRMVDQRKNIYYLPFDSAYPPSFWLLAQQVSYYLGTPTMFLELSFSCGGVPDLLEINTDEDVRAICHLMDRPDPTLFVADARL